jgi:glycine C-acetyltransferase
MPARRYLDHLRQTLDEIDRAGLRKRERVITTPQRPHLATTQRAEVVNFCANNYLGLADHPAVIDAAKKAMDRLGFGMASVRFICGTQQLHKDLEAAVSRFLSTEDTILYSSCFDANGGLFETLLGEQDAVLSDELNHASIIDGIRLCKARRLRYRNNDVADLEAKLKESADARFRMIATDGVFSMDGTIANLSAICELADRHDAIVMVDDSHAHGFLGPGGRGTPALHGVAERVDIVTGTFGKALGGGAGGFTSGRREIIDLLRQRSRPYLFSNSLPPAIVAASLQALQLLSGPLGEELRDRLSRNTRRFREDMVSAGYTVGGSTHPIVPIHFGEALPATRAAERLLELGIYVIAFSFPVVPQGKARIRVQLSAAHSDEDIDRAVSAFAQVKRELGL